MDWTFFKSIMRQIDQAIEVFVRDTVDEFERTYQQD